MITWLLENNVLPRIRTSQNQYRSAIRRLVDLAVEQKAVVIPSHDPLVWKTFQAAGPNWLKQLRKVSDRAVEGYMRAAGGRGPK